MEITILSPKSIKIRGKQATFIVDPVGLKGKQQADAIIGLDMTVDRESVDGAHVTFDGPGEYEIGGTKITGLGSREKTLFYFSIENMVLLLAKASSLKEKDIREINILLLHADEVSDSAALAATEASVILLYGEKAQETAKIVGKTLESVTKYSITKDKLPSEMEVVVFA